MPHVGRLLLVPYTAAALGTESLYGFLFLRLRRTESETLRIFVPNHPEIVPLNTIKRSIFTMSAYVSYTPVTPSFFSCGTK